DYYCQSHDSNQRMLF
nr:immunoglobulin light chain junction region [Macaca mulatta]MOX16755.1 immunoglobulin light chain junction region [Macaca mulatta]MOX17023.1 immunoglobulin light chain junction region [Macaca mulatta]MOX17405.1 immunoglobulin light chain junction region [Macaca mulatta]MOX17415.1 immunoglobulin light chain junction region [Macaca mulatta]